MQMHGYILENIQFCKEKDLLFCLSFSSKLKYQFEFDEKQFLFGFKLLN